MPLQNLQERPETSIATQDLENNFQLDLSKIQTLEPDLETGNEEKKLSVRLGNPTLFDRLSILGLVLIGGIIVNSTPRNLEQRNNIEQNPTTIQNIQNLRASFNQ
jgi:hypothetical protein